MGRTIVVGDVHGCRAELDALLDRVAFASGDRLVFVGDLVARGPDSLGVLDIARRTGALIVRGNHEDKLLAVRGKLGGAVPIAAASGLQPSHRELIRTLRPVDWTLLETSPVWLDLKEHDLRVVHGGVVPGIPFEEQDPRTIMRLRTVRVQGAARGRSVLWGAYYQGAPHVVFGHNAAPGLQLHKWATGLDTGCVYGGRLTALVLAQGQKVPRSIAQRTALLVSEAARRVYFDFARVA
jgi:diadenosine tetraphosphatase ApaH/serine/threonine PP2A family protein phosphatase